MYILSNINWLIVINRIIPFLALIMVAATLFSSRWGTKGKRTSTILHLFIVLWVLLIWADWGSDIFNPVSQTATARIVIFFIMYLMLNDIRHKTARLKQRRFNPVSILGK